MSYEPSMTLKRPFCECAESSVLTTAIYDRLLSSGTNVEFGFWCPFCENYYGYWLSDPYYWLLCKAIEGMVGVGTVRVSGEVKECVHPSYKSGMLMLEVADASDLRSR